MHKTHTHTRTNRNILSFVFLPFPVVFLFSRSLDCMCSLWIKCYTVEDTKTTNMAPTLTGEVWPVSALWMTPGFSDQLSSCWATCFPPFASLCFLRRLHFARLCCVLEPSPTRMQRNNKPQRVAINFRLVYDTGLLAHLWVNSGNRHYCPVFWGQWAMRPQLHPGHPALSRASMGMQFFYCGPPFQPILLVS